MNAKKQQNKGQRKGARRGDREPPGDPWVGSNFALVIGVVAGMTVLALVLQVALAVFGDGSEAVRAAAETCSATYKMGFGALVGLLGAHQLTPPQG